MFNICRDRKQMAHLVVEMRNIEYYGTMFPEMD